MPDRPFPVRMVARGVEETRLWYPLILPLHGMNLSMWLLGVVLDKFAGCGWSWVFFLLLLFDTFKGVGLTFA